MRGPRPVMPGVAKEFPRLPDRRWRLCSGRPPSTLGEQRKNALKKGGVPVNAAWLQQVLHFGSQPMDVRIVRGKLRERGGEFDPGFEIRRSLPARCRVHEIEGRHVPWRFDQRRDLFKEHLSQTWQRIARWRRGAQKLPQQAGLLGRYAHALPIDGIEPANGVTDGNEAAREDLQPFKMAQDIIPETMARDLTIEPGVLHGVVDCRRTQGSGESHEAIDITGWCIAVAFGETDDPAIFFDWPQERTTGARWRQPPDGKHRFPIRGCVTRYVKNGSRIAFIDPDDCFLRQGKVSRLQHRQGWRPMPGSIDDQVGGNFLATGAALLELHARHRHPIR